MDTDPPQEEIEDKDDETEPLNDSDVAKENMFGQDEDDVMEDPNAPRIIEDK